MIKKICESYDLLGSHIFFISTIMPNILFMGLFYVNINIFFIFIFFFTLFSLYLIDSKRNREHSKRECSEKCVKK